MDFVRITIHICLIQAAQQYASADRLNRSDFVRQFRAYRRTASQRRTLQPAAELFRSAVSGIILANNSSKKVHIPKGTHRRMNRLRKLGWLTLTLIACSSLSLWFLHIFGFGSPLFALLLHWMLMTWFALAGPVVEFYLPAHYYTLRPFEQSGRVYQRLGIGWFKRLVQRGPLAHLNPTLRLSHSRRRSTLHQLERELRKAETSHVYIFLIILVVTGYALLRQWFDASGWMLVCNIAINGYPIMLQRYNRSRLQALSQRPGA